MQGINIFNSLKYCLLLFFVCLGLRRTAGDALSDLGDVRAVEIAAVQLLQVWALCHAQFLSFSVLLSLSFYLTLFLSSSLPDSVSCYLYTSSLFSLHLSSIPSFLTLSLSLSLSLSLTRALQDPSKLVRWRAARILGELAGRDGTSSIFLLE